MVAAPNLNPSVEGEALPTLVRIVQLTSTAKAETLGSRDFWEAGPEVLGTDVVSQEEVTIDPGERLLRWVDRKGAANYLMVVALFREPQGVAWRTVIPLTPVEEGDCPAEAPPPRTGNPRSEDLKLQVTLQASEVRGNTVKPR